MMDDHGPGESTRSTRPISRRSLLHAAGVAVGATGIVHGTSADSQAPVADGFTAGAARIDASPTQTHLDEGVYLGGFGIGPQPSRRATGIHDGNVVRALALSAGDETVVLAVLDVTGFGNKQQQDIRDGVADATGLDRSRVLIHASHTHAGPDFQGLWGGVPASYRTFVVERATSAIVQALEAREPVRAFAGSVDAQPLASNRRYDDDRGTVSTVTALTFDAARGGETIGTVVNFGAHPTIIGSGNSLVATDYVGPLERAVEAEFGGVALYVQSAIGDASAAAAGAETEYAAAAQYGRRVASRASDALADAARVQPGLATGATTVRLPVDNCAFNVAFETGLLQPYYDAESVTGTALDPLGATLSGVSPAAGEAVDDAPESGGLAIHSPVARVSLGRRQGATVELVTVPGEAVTALGRDLVDVMQAAGADETMVGGLTQNSLGYLIPQATWQGGSDDGYEETVSLGPDTAPLYRNAVTELYDLDRSMYERLPPGPEHVCPDEQVRAKSQLAGILTEPTIR